MGNIKLSIICAIIAVFGFMNSAIAQSCQVSYQGKPFLKAVLLMDSDSVSYDIQCQYGSSYKIVSYYEDTVVSIDTIQKNKIWKNNSLGTELVCNGTNGSDYCQF